MEAIPVMWVIRKSSGKKVGINVSDFNPEIHEPYVEPSVRDEKKEMADSDEAKNSNPPDDEGSDDGSAPGDEVGKSEPEVEPPFNLSEETAADAVEFIAEIEDLNMLAIFEREEREGKERVTVLRAISKRLIELGVEEE